MPQIDAATHSHPEGEPRTRAAFPEQEVLARSPRASPQASVEEGESVGEGGPTDHRVLWKPHLLAPASGEAASLGSSCTTSHHCRALCHRSTWRFPKAAPVPAPISPVLLLSHLEWVVPPDLQGLMTALTNGAPSEGAVASETHSEGAALPCSPDTCFGSASCQLRRPRVRLPYWYSGHQAAWRGHMEFLRSAVPAEVPASGHQASASRPVREDTYR